MKCLTPSDPRPYCAFSLVPLAGIINFHRCYPSRAHKKNVTDHRKK